MKIHRMELNSLRTNAYFIINEKTSEALVVDPGWDSHELTDFISEEHLKVVAVLLTHGHFDHIHGVKMLQDLGIKVIASEKERKLLGDEIMNLSARFKRPVTVTPDETVSDGDILNLAGFEIRVIETPGHTSGCVCYEIEAENILFTGDTLFEGTVGRTDVPTGDWDTEVSSVRNRLFTLPDDMICCPGHGESTTIGHEKKYNTAAGPSLS